MSFFFFTNPNENVSQNSTRIFSKRLLLRQQICGFFSKNLLPKFEIFWQRIFCYWTAAVNSLEKIRIRLVPELLKKQLKFYEPKLPLWVNFGKSFFVFVFVLISLLGILSSQLHLSEAHSFVCISLHFKCWENVFVKNFHP